MVVILLLLLTGAALAATTPDSTVLRPGDQLFLALPGEESLNRDFVVDREGAVLLPEVGRVAVSGLTLAEARARIRDALARVFRDVSRFDLVLKERRLLVSVLGYVRTPGPVELPAGAGVQQAINAAGGLVPGAQLDRMQLRRDGQTTTFDYKRWLDTGDAAALPELQPLDTVFVPASPLTGNVQVEFDAQTLTAAGDAADARESIKVFGEVNNPGSFAAKPGATAVDYLLRAGGVTRFAGVEQIRILSQGEPESFNLKGYLDDPRGGAPEVPPGSTIFVPAASDEVKAGARIIYVMGEVFKPGAFEAQGDTGFLDALANAGGPTRFADTRQIRIIRAEGQVVPVDLAAFTENPRSAGRLPGLAPGDAILVPEKTDVNEKSWLKVPPSRAVQVMGAVAAPGRYEWSDEMSVLDLLGHAGGPTGRADTARIQVVPEPGGGVPEVFDLARFLAEGGTLASLPRVPTPATRSTFPSCRRTRRTCAPSGRASPRTGRSTSWARSAHPAVMPSTTRSASSTSWRRPRGRPRGPTSTTSASPTMTARCHGSASSTSPSTWKPGIPSCCRRSGSAT
jgi:protein involved in polysaccharide export with SLBB domain